MRKMGLSYSLQSPTSRLCTLDGSAFARVSEEDLTNYIGSYAEFVDSVGKVIGGYIKEADAAEALGSELLENTGFETAGGGGADVFANWSETAGSGTVVDEGVIVKSGSHAAKLTSGGVDNTLVSQGENIAAAVGKLFKISFYARGDGTNAGRYKVYDGMNAIWVIPATSTGVGGTSYILVEDYFTILSGGSTHYLYLLPLNSNGAIAYFDDISLKEVTHVGADGVHIVSASSGATRNWTSIDTGFDPNAIASVYVY